MNMNRLFIGLLTAIIVLLPCREISAKQKKEVKEVPDREVCVMSCIEWLLRY